MSSLKRVFHWYDRHFEPTIMIIAYASFSIIIAVEVVRRFLFHVQTTWGGQVSINLFIWLTWFACAWGIRNQAHLSFPGIRAKMSYKVQYGLCILDNVLWVFLGVVVYYGAIRMITMERMMESVIQGTNIPLWWSTMIVPLGWAAICLRVVQNIWTLTQNYKSGKPLVTEQQIRT